MDRIEPRIDTSHRRIARITLPVLITHLSFTSMGILDTVMVGRLGVTALAAVGLGNFIAWWGLSFVLGMITGVNTLVAQAVGAERPRAAGKAFWQGVYLAILLGGLTAALAPLSSLVISWTGAGAEVATVASSYMEVRLLGGLGLTILLVSDNFYRGLGRTEVPMWCGLGQLVLNCGFNYVLIFGKLGVPELGTVGAAWGTFAAQMIVALVLFATVVASRRHQRQCDVRTTWRFDPTTFRRLVRLSLPIGVQIFMEMGGITIFCALIARLGEAEMAATNAVIQAWSVAFMVAISLSVTATTLVGQCLGAGEAERGRRAVARILHLGDYLMAVLAVVYLAFPGRLMAFFVDRADLGQLLPYARPLFAIVVVCLYFDLRFNVLAGALRGAGDTTYAMVVNVGSAWLLFVPATVLATHHFGIVGAWSCLILHMAAMALLLHLRFASGAWVRPPADPGDEEDEEPPTPGPAVRPEEATPVPAAPGVG